jgi:hypothetical protein
MFSEFPSSKNALFPGLVLFPKPLVSVIIADTRYLTLVPLEPRTPLDQQVAVSIAELKVFVGC